MNHWKGSGIYLSLLGKLLFYLISKYLIISWGFLPLIHVLTFDFNPIPINNNVVQNIQPEVNYCSSLSAWGHRSPPPPQSRGSCPVHKQCADVWHLQWEGFSCQLPASATLSHLLTSWSGRAGLLQWLVHHQWSKFNSKDKRQLFGQLSM